MKPLLLVVLVLTACGGKAKPATDPSSATCCCVAKDGNEVVAETVCQDRGGTCDPEETCEAADPGDDQGDGGGDNPDY